MQLGLMIAITAETAILVPVTLRRRSYSSVAVIWADVTVVCVGLVLNGPALGPGVVDSGLNWFFAVSLGSAVGAAVGLPSPQAVVAVPAIGLAHCLPAVSYTHLRAHETPEHLVCRLLLEKKKQNIQI